MYVDFIFTCNTIVNIQLCHRTNHHLCSCIEKTEIYKKHKSDACPELNSERSDLQFKVLKPVFVKKDMKFV
jgi:hypothetical protein